MFCLHERVLEGKKGDVDRWPRRIFDAFKKNPKLRLESNGKVDKGFLQWACCNSEATRRISLFGRKATQSSGEGGMPKSHAVAKCPECVCWVGGGKCKHNAKT